MKSKKDAMDSEDDYDQMLRAMFESCDTVGLGLLTMKDFEKLCKKLSIQEHSSLLSEVLFPETNKRKLLPYETFRDTLILFLSGDAGFANCSTEINKNTHPNPEDHWNNNSVEYHNENRIQSQPKSEMITEFPEDILSKDANENCHNFTGSVYNGSSPDSQKKYRRYGRKSKPDMDLLSNRKSEDSERPVVLTEVQVESTSDIGSMEDVAPDNSPLKAVEVSFLNEEDLTPTIRKEEEFVGEGKDDAWKNPDSDWLSDINANAEDSKATTVQAVQTELETAWSIVVGDPITDALCESQLGSLCAELGLEHIISIGSSDDMSVLFAALDGDNDGFVTFHEFSDQMSMFMNSDESNLVLSGEDRIPPEGDLRETDSLNSSRDFVFSSCEIIEEDGTFLREDPMMSHMNDVRTNHVTSRPQTPVDVTRTFECAIEFNSAKTTPTRNETSSPAQSATTSEGPWTPESCGRLSIDSDTSPLCPPVVSVEPRQLAAANRGRRRRRSPAVAVSNPAGLRHQRRKSGRSIPLPHYHPASIRKLEALPLSFLTEENERYISLDTLRQSWEQEGLEDSSAVLEALELSSADQSISVEALSEVLEMELDQNIIQKAALILYKRGISHYRSMYDHERTERSKHERNIEHLMLQLQDQEERLEQAESNFREKADEMEAKYKAEIRALTDELGAAQSRMKEYERESQTNRKEEFNKLTEKYEKSKGFLEDLSKENEKLWKEKEDAESRLMDAEDAVMKMRENLERACRGIALSNRQIASQRKQHGDFSRMFDGQTESLQDDNDELFDQLQQSIRESSPCRSKSQSTRRKTHGFSSLLRHSDPSSYSPASEECHHLSTCQVFVDDSPNPADPQEHLLKSSPTSEIQENGKLVTSNAFAFLSPTTTRTKARIQSYALLAIAPPTSSPKIFQTFKNTVFS